MIELSKKRPSTPTIVLTALAAAYISAAVVLGTHLTFSGDVSSVFPTNFLTASTPLDVLWWLLLGGTLYVALSYAGRVVATLFHATKKARAASAFARSLVDPDYAEAGSVTPGKTMSMTEVTGELAGRRLSTYIQGHQGLFKGISLAVFACWLGVFVFYYPGTSMNDQFWIIADPLAASSVHPLLYCLFLSWPVNATKLLLGDGSIGFATFVLVRMGACACVVSILCCWLRWRGAKAPLVWVVALVFALCPVIADNAVCSIKDTLFSFVLLLWIPFFDEYLRRRGSLFEFEEERKSYVVLCVLTGITRNNGLVVVVLLIAAVLIAAPKRTGMKQVVASSVLAIALVMTPNLVSRTLLHVQYSSVEALGVPLQQLAAVRLSPEGTMTAEQRSVFDQAVDPGVLPSVYYPVFVDGVKFRGALHADYANAHSSDLLRVWREVAFETPANLDLYVRAWLSTSYGCWCPMTPCDPAQSYFFREINNMSYEADDYYGTIVGSYKLATRSLMPKDATAAFKVVWEPLVVSPCTGGLFCIVLVLAVLACHKEGSAARGILPYLPLILLWLSLMLAVPLSQALRYGLGLYLAIPILVALLVLPENRTGESAAVLASDQAERMREEWPF